MAVVTFKSKWSDFAETTATELKKRLPARLFDVHAHLDYPQELGDKPRTGGAVAWREHVERQTGVGSLSGGLLFPMPAKGCDLARLNEELLAELKETPDVYGLLLAGPGSNRATLVAQLDAQPRLRGFKPYHLMSTQEPTFQSPIASFMPIWLQELANERGLILMLHMVRDRAMADERNQAEIREICTAFPNVKLVLAHAARGFHSPNTVKGISALRGLDNVWFDMSGVCEPAAMSAILHEFGPRRVMWASDYPISERPGKCVTVGDNFAWINPEQVDAYPTAPAVQTLPVGLENLQALLTAADEFGLNAVDLEDVFCNNAERLLGIQPAFAEINQQTYVRARQRIPAGTHLLSKRPEMFAPQVWPPYAHQARGCEIWDLDGRHYYDVGLHGIGACLLGFRDPDVSRAVRRALNMGSMSTLNPPEELELADKLCAIHPWAEQVRLTRTGGELAAVAVRIARATTDRSEIAVCGYHGWHDWYLAANLGDNDSLRGHLLPGLDPLGVPRELRGTTHPFTYNNREQFARIIAEHGRNLAAVVMEPCRAKDPEPGFLEFIRDEAHKAGALLIFDEITIGWRTCYGGAHLRLGVQPDMAMFAKSLGNGHPIAAVIGTREAMDGANSSFISSAYWTESIGPAAAIAALDKMKQVDVVAHVHRIGSLFQDVLRSAARKHGLPITVAGYPAAPSISFDTPDALVMKTFYIQEMLDLGFMAGTLIYVNYAHNEEIVGRFAKALDLVFAKLADALAKKDLAGRLRGPVAHSGFSRLL